MKNNLQQSRHNLFTFVLSLVSMVFMVAGCSEPSNPGGSTSLAAPNITTQPASHSIEEGNSTSLSVTATAPDGATLSYQWQKAASGATDFANIDDATSASYKTPILNTPDSGVQYRVIVKATKGNLTSSTTSGTATITVTAATLAAPTISTQPSSQRIEEGYTASLTVAATAPTGATLSYQWQKAMKGSNSFSDVSGATSASYTTPILAVSDSGVQYRVVVAVTNETKLISTDTSDIATISVFPTPLPVINKQPASQNIEEGGAASLAVAATVSNGATLSYQWQMAAKDASDFADIPDATNERYTTPELTAAESGVQYRVIVTATNTINRITTATSTIASVSVFATPPIEITKQPTSQSILEGGAASLTVTATALTGATISYQWQTAVSGSEDFADIAEATSASYTTPALNTTQSGVKYRVVVTATSTIDRTRTTTVTSDIATIRVFATPPPTINKQPASQRIEEGYTASLAVVATASDGATLSYQWQKAANGATVFTDIAGATADSYTTAELNVSDNGVQYRVVVTATDANNRISITISDIATLSVFATPLPVITTQPSSQTITEGNTADLTVVATHPTGAALSYQWQTAAKGSTSFSDVSGATSTSYTTPTLAISDSGVQYRVIVTATNTANRTSVDTSGIATITVTGVPPAAPAITTQPASQRIEEDKTVSLSVTADTPDGATLSYQWQTAPSGSINFTDIEGANSDTYTTRTLGISDNGIQYRVVVTATNDAGLSSSTISQVVTISVLDTPSPPFVSSPQSQTIEEGNTVTLSVIATSSSSEDLTVRYQWQKAAKGSNDFTDIADATSDSYTTPILNTTDNGVQYRVVVTVTNAANLSSSTKSSIAIISVLPTPPPNITKQPASKRIEEGYTDTLRVEATASNGATLSYQWQTATKDATDFANIDDATSASYTTPILNTTDNGVQYRVITTATSSTTNRTGSDTSDIATLSVFPTPQPVIGKQPASHSIQDGETVSLRVEASHPTGAVLSYQWQEAAKDATDFADITGATSDSYTTPILNISNNDIQYRVIITATSSVNRTSSDTSDIATISVFTTLPPVITTQPASQSIEEGYTASLSVEATTSNGATLSYQWQKAMKGSQDFADITGATADSYTTPALATTDSAVQYRAIVTATDNASSQTSATTTETAIISVTTLPLPAITTQPAPTKTVDGSTASLTVVATAVTGAALSYQWQTAASGSNSFTDISGATAASYTTPTLTSTNNGVQYRVVVKATNGANKTKTTTSDIASVSVLDPANTIIWTHTDGTKRYAGAPGDNILGSSHLTPTKNDIKSVDVIPNRIHTIKWNGFENCKNLESIVIPNSVTRIYYRAFNGCSSLASVTMPNNIGAIENGTFSECTSLASITIPASVTSIGESAFYKCTSLTSITIPSNVTSIGNGAFTACTNLTSMRVEATTPPTAVRDTFNRIPRNISITVPAASVDAYKAAEGWKEYANQITGY